MSFDKQEEIFDEVRAATDAEADLKERVRVIVMKAMIDREVAPAAIREVISATVDGVGEGLVARGAQAGTALRDAMQGMDEAVASCVHSLQMALEEAWGNGRQFADGDVRETVESMRSLEQDLLKTLRDAAEKSQGWLKSEFGEVLGHMQRTGTDTGARVKTVMESLNSRLVSSVAGYGKDARTAAEQSKARLSQVASGILRGLADALDAKSR